MPVSHILSFINKVLLCLLSLLVAIIVMMHFLEERTDKNLMAVTEQQKVKQLASISEIKPSVVGNDSINKLTTVDDYPTQSLSFSDMPSHWPDQVKKQAMNFNHPATDYWRQQIQAHEKQPMTTGWLNFLSYTVNKQRDPLALPTFAQMASAESANGHLVIRLESEVLPEALEKLGVIYEKTLGQGLVQHLYRFYHNSVNVEWLLEQVNAVPGVLYAEPDYSIDRSAYFPNDTLASINTGEAWWLEMINAYNAWDIATDASAIGPIGVLDTGIDLTHEDLKNNLWFNTREIPNNGIDDDNNGLIDDQHGFNPGGDMDHGTRVAGAICAEGNNELGVVGSAWKCQLMDLGTEIETLGVNAYISQYSQGMAYAAAQGSRLSNHNSDCS